MFSSSPAIGALKPGLVAGHYPERKEDKKGIIDHAFNRLEGRIALLSFDRYKDFKKFCLQTDQAGKAVSLLSDQDLQKQGTQLQRQFSRYGLNQKNSIEAFALIREFSSRILGMRHYDVQIMGGWTILQGQLAEMETGEGKTLAATLAAATAALAGIPVHVLTVNDYLVKRDAELMAPLYKALGLTVGYATQEMTAEQRKSAYACNITYATNKVVAFDYLRDRLLLNDSNHLRLQLEPAYRKESNYSQLLLRGLCFAIVDEADSLLIDEARTPLILTQTVQTTERQSQYLTALNVAKTMRQEIDFYLDTNQRLVQISLTGQKKIAEIQQTKNQREHRHNEELIRQALHALHLLQKDREYLIQDDKVHIIDANTGRTMPDRSWEHGLHQLVEAKENCSLTENREQLGRITYQRFFRRYLRLGGMTGTAREVGHEIWKVYSLKTRRIPLNRPSKRKQLTPETYVTCKEKWNAVIKEIEHVHLQGRPILVGTGSVADSETISNLLQIRGLKHRVLNARQDKEEADIIAQAAQLGQITVATNMAGRGTDIVLAPEVKETDGLHIIVTCLNDSARIDRQLFGRCARQGDPGSYRLVLSLEDDLMMKNASTTIISKVSKQLKPQQKSHQAGLKLMRRYQRKTEQNHYQARRNLLQMDLHLKRSLTFSGEME
jgi:preprotein translocase subunit SecA